MLESLCDVRQVMESFWLADIMKGGPFDPSAYLERLAVERGRLAGLNIGQIESGIHDGHRLVRYKGGMWRSMVVQLADCSVWPHMGGRRWATGPVLRVVEMLPRMGASTDRLLQMARMVSLWISDLPLIVFQRGRAAGQFRIDDGCHRAVAAYMAGYRQMPAFSRGVGGRHKLEWKWEGDGAA